MDEAYAWEVATVRVCLHVLFSSFALPVLVFHQSTTRLVFGFVSKRIDFVVSAFFDGFAFFPVAFS